MKTTRKIERRLDRRVQGHQALTSKKSGAKAGQYRLPGSRNPNKSR
jgi:hypothetical protein